MEDLGEDRFRMAGGPADGEISGTLRALVEIQEVLMPGTRFSVEDTGSTLTMTIRGQPPAYKQLYAQTYRELPGGNQD